jgi:hypothetical protein
MLLLRRQSPLANQWFKGIRLRVRAEEGEQGVLLSSNLGFLYAKWVV